MDNKQLKEMENDFFNHLRTVKAQRNKNLANPKYFVDKFDIEIINDNGVERIKFCGERQPARYEIEAIKNLKPEIIAEIKKRNKEFEDEIEKDMYEFENKYHNEGEE
jgi:hypothetical protein